MRPPALILARARCDCHIWIVSAIDRIGRCRRCGQVPERLPGTVTDEKTVCLHDGDCWWAAE